MHATGASDSALIARPCALTACAGWLQATTPISNPPGLAQLEFAAELAASGRQRPRTLGPWPT